ncbi:Fic family protein [Paramicrobacterium fandaimingii]|uniref:Fic family protein n=1 Tax=Paramicrobacterium fandaimingii TaxID=2708079 RepID=UPI001424822B|nr:Fic family protein [Microbacterium fandaimingii]
MPTDRLPGEIRISPLSRETRQWRPRNPGIFSHAEVKRQTGTYESAVTPAIHEWTPELSGEDATNIEEAALALADFDRHALTRLGQNNPALGPMAAILLRTESASSSQIELLTTSAKQLALAEIEEGDKANALSVVGNVRAMEAALRLSGVLDSDSIRSMHRELMAHDHLFRDEAGTYRQELVWIGNRDNAGPIGAEFIAPQHTRVSSAIDDLIRFMQRTDIPVLVHIAVAHAQFETIHPFSNGNGRTGRALAQALLRNKGMATHTTVPISGGLLTDTRTYFAALSAYRNGDAGPIVRRFADASRFAAVTGRRLVDNLHDQLEGDRATLAGLRPQSVAWRVLPLLIGQPIVNTKYLMNALHVSDMSILRALSVLTERGIVVERTGQSRNRVWQHNGILGVLDEYANDARRTAQ